MYLRCADQQRRTLAWWAWGEDWEHGCAQMRGKLVVEHGKLHHRLVVDKGELQLAQLDTHDTNGAECRNEQDEYNQ